MECIHHQSKNIIDLISLSFTIITTIFIIYLTYLALKHSTKPKIKIKWKEKGTKFSSAKDNLLTFELSNAGYCYGKPAAKNITFYFNFLPPIEPIEIRFGVSLENINKEVKNGKAGAKRLKAEGIYLLYDEPAENVEILLKTPKENGKYKFWISAISDDGVEGKFDYKLIVNGLKTAHYKPLIVT